MGWKYISNYSNFNGGNVEVWKWISNFIPHITIKYLSTLGLKLIHISERGPRTNVKQSFYTQTISFWQFSFVYTCIQIHHNNISWYTNMLFAIYFIYTSQTIFWANPLVLYSVFHGHRCVTFSNERYWLNYKRYHRTVCTIKKGYPEIEYEFIMTKWDANIGYLNLKLLQGYSRDYVSNMLEIDVTCSTNKGTNNQHIFSMVWLVLPQLRPLIDLLKLGQE